MIQAFVFDLDGTLVNSEPLRNLAHARAVLELRPDGMRPEEVIAIAEQHIGVPAPDIAKKLVRQLGLEEPARARMHELGAHEPWQVYLQLQTAAYNQLRDEPGVLQRAQMPKVVSLLHRVRRTGFKTGMATNSTRYEAQRAVDILNWEGLFDAVLTADDVRHGKPAPEIYECMARMLCLLPEECLVIEDSPSGIAAALSAGMKCIAVPSDLTRSAVHQTALDERWIVDDAERLETVVQERLALKDQQ